jgi:predicted phage-related endonuclease
MALNAAQLAQRAGKLTASRIACLMTGNAGEIHKLWLEMTGQALPKDLSDVWPAQLGDATEELNLRWFQKRNYPLSKSGEFVTHPQYPWAGCTLDGWCEELACPVEAKHTGGREPLEVIIERYQPQLQWQMACTQSKQAALSVIMGASQPIVEFVDRADEYIDEMIVRGRQFMGFVERKEPPVTLPAVPAPIDASKVYDMNGQNRWASNAFLWLENRKAALVCEDCAKTLKAIVPADAKKCFGHGVRITRDRAGRLSLREDA